MSRAQGFDPDRATRQLFVDSIVRTMGTANGGDGYGLGWHIVFLESYGSDTIVTFENPRALIGWDSAGEARIDGPHLVRVTITALPRPA